uniref:Rab-GAP TBC domain-containing protein n=1 Tax=Lepeophtheirus salmonis TaxID=72036 RepID=A0A0K2TYD0_LEPSM
MDEEEELVARLRAAEERRLIVNKYERGRGEGAVIDAWEDPEYEIFHIADRYGFLHDNRLPDASHRTEREKKQNRIEASRCQKWSEMFNKKEKYFIEGARDREKMINRVYKGVPASVRGMFWAILLNVDPLKDKHKGLYADILQRALKHSPDIRQIDLDVNRTYRNNTMFSERYSTRQKALFHILAAYSVYNTKVGYCQGMSQIVALLLMYLPEEEDVFWALSSLMVDPKYLMHGFFIQGFPKLLRFQNHHEKVLKKFLPNLKKHLDKNGIDTGIYTLKWFFQCFLDRIPFSLALRVWDLYILEGDRVLIAMAYNILRMHRHYLMKLGMDEIMEYLQIKLEKNFRFEDSIVIDKLRKTMYDLRDFRLDSPNIHGIPPSELPPENINEEAAKFNNSVEREAGLRSRFLSDKEKEFSQHTLQRQIETENRIKQEPSLDEGSCDHSLDDTSSLLDESKSEMGIDSSFDTVDDPPTRSSMGGRVISPSSTKSGLNKYEDSKPSYSSIVLPPSPLPPSEAQTKLDESLRLMLHTASLNNGLDKVETFSKPKKRNGSSIALRSSKISSSVGVGGGGNNNASKRVSSISFPGTDQLRNPTGHNNNKREGSSPLPKVLSSEGDVVRIHVPYDHNSHINSNSSCSTSPHSNYVSSPPPPSSLTSTRYEGNKVLIPVNSENLSLSSTFSSSRIREVSSSSASSTIALTKVTKTFVVSSSTASSKTIKPTSSSSCSNKKRNNLGNR